MANVFNAVVLHLVWATKDRAPTLTHVRLEAVCQEVIRQATALKCAVIAVNGVGDHIHVLLRISTTCTIADLVGKMKGASSRRINRHHKVEGEPDFEWQGGYGVFPVEPKHVTVVAEYVRNQAEHHRNRRLFPTLERDAEDDEAEV